MIKGTPASITIGNVSKWISFAIIIGMTYETRKQTSRASPPKNSPTQKPIAIGASENGMGFMRWSRNLEVLLPRQRYYMKRLDWRRWSFPDYIDLEGLLRLDIQHFRNLGVYRKPIFIIDPTKFSFKSAPTLKRPKHLKWRRGGHLQASPVANLK